MNVITSGVNNNNKTLEERKGIIKGYKEYAGGYVLTSNCKKIECGECKIFLVILLMRKNIKSNQKEEL